MGNDSSASAEEEHDTTAALGNVPNDFPTNTNQITLHDAALKGNRTLQEFLTKICPKYPEDAAELLKAKDGLQCLPFHHAVAGGHSEAVTGLAEKYLQFKLYPSKADLVNASVAHGASSLHIAIVAGHLDIVKLLLEMGADVNKKTSDGVAPLHVACIHGDTRSETEGGSLSIVKLLVGAGSDINALTKEKESAYELATQIQDHGPPQQDEIIAFLKEQPGIFIAPKADPDDIPELEDIPDDEVPEQTKKTEGEGEKKEETK